MADVYTAKDVAKRLKCSESKAYAVIREINKELTAKGKFCLRGRVSIKAFEEKII